VRLSSLLTKGLSEAQEKQLADEIKHSVLAAALRGAIREEIERSYRAEEQVTGGNDDLPFYLKEVGERRGYRQILRMILEE